MKKFDDYTFYFKSGEPKMLGKEHHVHVWGHGREIQFYISDKRALEVKEKKPKNFPEREESKIKDRAKEKRKGEKG